MAGMIGVFGGSFDPPHLGHLILADEARAALGLERILWVVAGDPPHKPEQPMTEAALREEMVEAAIDGNPAFVLSKADLNRPGPHYTVDTLRQLRSSGLQAPFAYLMGSDSLVQLPEWHRPEEFIELCGLIGVLRRPGNPVDWALLGPILPGLREKVRMFDAPLVAISGRGIRARVAEGRAYRYLVLPRVAERIEAHQLYR